MHGNSALDPMPCSIFGYPDIPVRHRHHATAFIVRLPQNAMYLLLKRVASWPAAKGRKFNLRGLSEQGLPTMCVSMIRTGTQSGQRFKRTRVVDFTAARINCLQQLIHLFVAHLLAEVRQDCAHRVSNASKA